MNRLEELKLKQEELTKKRNRFQATHNPKTTPRDVFEREMQRFSKELLRVQEEILNEGLKNYQEQSRMRK